MNKWINQIIERVKENVSFRLTHKSMNLHEQRNYIIMRYNVILFMHLHVGFEKNSRLEKVAEEKNIFLSSIYRL